MSVAALVDVVRRFARQAPPDGRLVERLLGTRRWLVRADLADAFFNMADFRLDQVPVNGPARIVKDGPHRCVYELNLPEGRFFLKHYKSPDWKSRVRNLFRGCQARREWLAVRKLAALRQTTFEAVALGTSASPLATGESFLVSRAVDRAIPLDHYIASVLPQLEPAVRAVIRQRLARELGVLSARLHRAAVLHRDLHAANLLVRADALERPQVTLIDLHAVTFRRRLTMQCRHRNLAELFRSFVTRATRSDRRRFFEAYLRELGTRLPVDGSPHGDGAPGAQYLRSETRRELEALEALLPGVVHAGWKRADAAWRRGNRHVRKVDRGSRRCRGLAEFSASFLESFRDDPLSLVANEQESRVKKTASRQVARVAIDTESSGYDAHLKVFDQPSIRRRLERWFRPTRVRRAWEAGHALLRRGIDTPRPLAMVESGGPGGRFDCLLTETVPDALTAREYFDGPWKRLNLHDRREFMARHSQRLAASLAHLHECGFDHRDLKFANLLVQNSDLSGRVWILDLDGVRTWRRIPWQRAVQNLSRLAASALAAGSTTRADRMRFLRIYLKGRPRAEVKWWWRKIARRCEVKAALNARRRRELT